MLGNASENASIASSILSNSSSSEYIPPPKKMVFSYPFVNHGWRLSEMWKSRRERSEKYFLLQFRLHVVFLNAFFVMLYAIPTSMYHCSRYESVSWRWSYWPVDITRHNSHKSFSLHVHLKKFHTKFEVFVSSVYMICQFSIPWAGYEKIYNNIFSAFEM
jgi:hypothetical protein